MNGMRKEARVADAAGVVLLGTMTLIISQSLSERAVWVYEGSHSLTVCSRSIFDRRTATAEIKPQRLLPNKLQQQLETMKLFMWVHRVERLHPTKPPWCTILYYASSVHKDFE